ncbi:MAG TPA: hypothetical protein VM142_07750 [Acidimicrobiales bacterium]|nr:hypothetical protein [Acidimicrobiales bacterium]
MDRARRPQLISAVRIPDDPIVGWRYWHLGLEPVLLGSVTQRGFRWNARQPIKARCVSSGHAAPAPGCACGVYAGAELSGLRDHGLCLPAGGLVVGEVGLWGLVLTEEDGHRGEFGYPRRLSVVTETVEAAVLAGVVEELAAAYGVPVDTVDRASAVGEVSAAIAAFLDMSSPR